MNYLAFDIEAANGYMPSSICSIGIVIADEQFHIIERKNIWINPKTKYNLNGTRQNVGIDLHLDKALLDRSPDFAAFAYCTRPRGAWACRRRRRAYAKCRLRTLQIAADRV